MASAKSTRKKSSSQNPPFLIKSITITRDVQEQLDRLSQDASDFLGWTVSHSALIRALVRQVVQQGPAAADALFLEVGRELERGVVWGKKEVRAPFLRLVFHEDEEAQQEQYEKYEPHDDEGSLGVECVHGLGPPSCLREAPSMALLACVVGEV